MGVVRQTFQRCLQVQRILGTLLINYEERDVSMNRQVQQELKERMNRNRVVIPQVFVEGQLLGVSDTFLIFIRSRSNCCTSLKHLALGEREKASDWFRIEWEEPGSSGRFNNKSDAPVHRQVGRRPSIDQKRPNTRTLAWDGGKDQQQFGRGGGDLILVESCRRQLMNPCAVTTTTTDGLFSREEVCRRHSTPMALMRRNFQGEWSLWSFGLLIWPLCKRKEKESRKINIRISYSVGKEKSGRGINPISPFWVSREKNNSLSLSRSL